jgi:phenylpropionate dioxygenase-like ring-hydroxylating dioxygenase large terminal subunit
MFLALKQDIPLDHVVPLTQYRHTMSVANTGEFHLISNVCPHQNSRIAQCATTKLECPYHGLQFNCHGLGVGNDNFLDRWECYTNQTMLFDQYVDCVFPVSTKHMELKEHREDIVNALPEIIMDVFLDVEHIPVAHKGVYDAIGITNVSDLQWSLFSNGSIQVVPTQDNSHIIEDDQKYNLGAAWMAIYPGTMIEWQPGALFITIAQSHIQGSCVQVYKYQDTRYSDSRWAVNQQVWELAWAQDKQLSELIVSVPHQNLDDLKQHHRVWMQDAV